MSTITPPTADLLWETLDERDTLEEPSTVPAVSRVSSIRVVLADNHPLFRDGLSRAISSHIGLDLVGEAADGADALALIEELEPDVALLDVKMPALDGIEVCSGLQRRDPPLGTRVVLLSAYLDPALVFRAVCAGAAGYLSKEESRVEICDALIGVARGELALAPRAANGLIEELERLYQTDPPGTTGV